MIEWIAWWLALALSWGSVQPPCATDTECEERCVAQGKAECGDMMLKED